MTNDYIHTAGDLSGLISMITNSSGNELPNIWRTVVSKIGKNNNEEVEGDEVISLGEKLAANSHVVDLKNGVLLVEANHSGWIQYLKMYQKFIIKGLSWAVPDLKINSLAFRVAGSTANLSERYDEQVAKAQKEMNEKIEATEQKLKKMENKENKPENNKNSSEGLPPELLATFERLKSSMLTNSKE